jgi:hypothetical protein
VFGFVLAVAGCAICANAADTMINFSSLSQTGSGYTSEGNTYTQQGFTFTDELNGDGNGFAVWDASSPNLPGLATANTSLFEFYAGSTTQLTDAGNLFTMNSIDLAQYNTPQGTGTFNVTFQGTFADSSTVSQTFTVNESSGTPALQTFTFLNFINVDQVTFTQGPANSGSAYQFDNLDMSVTPEPASMLLFGTGLVGIIFVMRKRLFAQV